MTAISMLLLILMVGLCIDLSRIYTARAELQNAADAAAVSAAKELNGGDTGIDKAVARANEIVNTYGFGKGNVTISTITFAKNLYPDGDYKSAKDAKDDAANIRFVKVVTGSASTEMLFASTALGPSWSENRQAIAGNSAIAPSTICDFFPAAVAMADPSGDLADPAKRVMSLKFNQGTGTEAELAEKDYIILEVPDITGTGTPETAFLTAGIANFCKTLGQNINMTPSSNKNNGPKNSGDGINTRFNEYAVGYKDSLEPDIFHPDSNIMEDITHQQYVDGSPIKSPEGDNFELREDGRRMLIMPIIKPGKYPGYTTKIDAWGQFFLKNKADVIKGNCEKKEPVDCGKITVEFVKMSPPLSPVVPTAESSSVTLPVIFR
jgi:Flp pilus assembly protein TadG